MNINNRFFIPVVAALTVILAISACKKERSPEIVHDSIPEIREEIVEIPEIQYPDNREVVLKFIEAFNNRDTTALESVFANPVALNGEEYDLDTFINNSWVERLWKSFPDAQITPTHIVTGEDYVTLRAEGEMTGVSEYLGFDVDDKKIRISEMSLLRIRDGKIVEWWYESDMLGFWEQLGLVEDPISGK